MQWLTLALGSLFVAPAGLALAQDATTYRVLATSKTSAMQKKMRESAAPGLRFITRRRAR